MYELSAPRLLIAGGFALLLIAAPQLGAWLGPVLARGLVAAADWWYAGDDDDE